VAVGGLLAAVVLPVVLASQASAASLNSVMVRLDRMQAGQHTSGMVCAKPGTALGQTSVAVNFTGFTVSTTQTDWAVDTTATSSWPTGAVAWTGIAQPTLAPTGTTVIFVSGALASTSTLYCFNWTNTTTALTVPAAGNYSGTVTTGGTVDSGTFSTTTLSSDQITVQATVPQSFAFSIGATNTDNLGTLATGSVTKTTGGSERYANVDTNAASGWQVWAKDSNAGLKSTAAGGYTIGSGQSSASVGAGVSRTLTTGSDGYVTGITTSKASGPAITVPAAFQGSANTGAGLDTTLRTMASSTGPTQTGHVIFTNNATIGTLTPAASDYSDLITVVGAGMF
jgi:hypothetical protein